MRHRMSTVGDRIRLLRKRAGLNQVQFATELDVSQSTISKWEKNKQEPEREALIKMSNYFRKDLHTLLVELGLDGDSPPTTAKVPVVGYVGAGSEAHFYADAQGPFDEIDMPSWGTELTVAVEIRGSSLGQILAGWVAYFDQRQDPPTDALIGRLCVVELEGGQVLVKVLQRGRIPGTFDLHSQTEAPLLDQDVVWAARVTGMTPK
jgi:transcriptional regulator with XRE-family HTH domain